ncbi:PAS domain-containing sensor histidine kinase [Arenibaculum sp.]|uniref:PAS domain-containing sensor histidine kinase n=1 Tax=Arenibaculum sp. TaxID=2865862 RepID=UPI002E15E4A0|nr:ATP-binding protein [Arenibaculum sp.]
MSVQEPRRADDPLVARLLGTLLEDAPLLFHIKDELGRYVAASRTWAEMLGLERDLLVGRTDAELLPPPLAELLRSREEGVPRIPRFSDSEEELPAAGGTRHLLARRFVAEDSPSGLPYLFMVAGDVTAQTQMRDALKAAVVAKARLLASACHDLRQPLQAAALFLEVLRRRLGRDQRAGDAAAAAGRALQAIERIVGELLTLSQIEAMTEHPRPGPVKLGDLLAELAAEFAPRAEAKGLRLRVVATSVTVASDAHLLARILRNLLSNAIAYTETGGVVLGCRRRPGAVEIQVADTGPGIPEADRETVFTEFQRLGAEASREAGGFGLGLAIVMRLAALLDHRVGLRSVPGSGSVFSVTVPLATPEWTGEPMLPRLERRHRAVLMVGGEPLRGRVLPALAQLGLEAVEAGNLGELSGVLGRMREAPLLVVAGRALDGGSFGTEAVAHARARFGAALPAVLVADRISPALRHAARTARCRAAQLPLSAPELSRLIAAGATD